MLLSYATLLAVLIPGVGVSAGGAQRWLSLPGLTFEPSEFAKLAVVIFLAHSLAAKGEHIRDFKQGLLPHLLVAGAFVAAIMRQPDFGTCITIGMVTMVMLFVAGVRWHHLAALIASAVPLLAVAILCADYRMRRVVAFLSPWDDPLGHGFQIIHSFLAFGSGGVLGQGAGAGLQKLWYLPQSHTDFIFSVLAEELGLVGVVFVVALFLVLIVRGIMLSARASHEGNQFGSYLALGLTLMIGLQALINIAVVMGLLPTKGLTLPFISYGGTSLALNLVAVGMLLNVAAQLRRA
jgi:cell division protein FtsW